MGSGNTAFAPHVHAGTDPSNGGDVAGAGARSLPDTGSGPDASDHGTVALLLALASGAAGAAIVTWVGRRKRSEQ